jgi:hypothetical protein
MKKVMLLILTSTAITGTALASRIIECQTLGGKNIKVQYGYNGQNTVLEFLSVDGQDSAAAEFLFSRSGMRLKLQNGTSINEDNGVITQINSQNQAVKLVCRFLSTDKIVNKEF